MVDEYGVLQSCFWMERGGMLYLVPLVHLILPWAAPSYTSRLCTMVRRHEHSPTCELRAKACSVDHRAHDP